MNREQRRRQAKQAAKEQRKQARRDARPPAERYYEANPLPAPLADFARALEDAPDDAVLSWEPNRPTDEVTAEYRERLPGALTMLVAWRARRAVADSCIDVATRGPEAAVVPLVSCPECRDPIMTAVTAKGGAIIADAVIERQPDDAPMHRKPWGPSWSMREPPWEAVDRMLGLPVNDWADELVAQPGMDLTVMDRMIRELHRWDAAQGAYVMGASRDVAYKDESVRVRDFLVAPVGLDLPDPPPPLWARCSDDPGARRDWQLDRDRLVEAALAGDVYDWSL